MIWIELAACAALMIWAGTLVSKYGDVIAGKTGLGRVWMGPMLIAGITALPELASAVSTVAWLTAPNLAAGAALGSCFLNLVLIAFMAFAYQPGRILAKAQDVHILFSPKKSKLSGIGARFVRTYKTNDLQNYC